MKKAPKGRMVCTTLESDGVYEIPFLPVFDDVSRPVPHMGFFSFQDVQGVFG